MRFALIPALLAASATSMFCADQELLNLVMPNAHALAGANVQSAKNSTFGQFVIGRMQDDKSLAKMIESTGFDPRRDLDEILLGSTADVTSKSPASKSLALVRGRFDANKIAAMAKTLTPMQVERRSGFDIYTSGQDKSGGFVFLTSTVAAAGDVASLREVIDRKMAGSKISQDVAKRVQAISASNDVWMLSLVSASTFTGPFPTATRDSSPMHNLMTANMFRSLDQAAMGFHFAADYIEMNLETVSKTEKDATALADVVRMAANMVVLQRENSELAILANVFEAMKLNQQAKTVSLRLAIPQSEIERIFDTGKSVRRI